MFQGIYKSSDNSIRTLLCQHKYTLLNFAFDHWKSYFLFSRKNKKKKKISRKRKITIPLYIYDNDNIISLYDETK